MARIFVITTASRLARSLKRYYGRMPEHEVTPVVLSETHFEHQSPAKTFGWIADKIERATPQDGTSAVTRDSVAILDVYGKNLSGLAAMSPIRHDIGHWPVAASMLLLAFPEMCWLFYSPYDRVTPPSFPEDSYLGVSPFLRRIPLSRRRDIGDLLDPFGLRNTIREAILNTKNEGGPVLPNVPTRDAVAVTVDDEESQAFFNAYVAYRFGYCACPITNWRALQKALGEDPLFQPNLLLEDLYLGFPDKDRNLSLSSLKERDEHFSENFDKKLKRRIIITVGHRETKRMQNGWHKNIDYLGRFENKSSTKKERVKTNIIYKPISGIFHLWNKMGMPKSSGISDSTIKFEWPPRPGSTSRQPEGHSAPGRILVIAERLADRSRSILEDPHDVLDVIHAATLALEAKELLADRTPTTALEALALQHRAEVRAESMFRGIEFNLDVQSRFEEINREVQAVAHWFSGRRRRRVTLNARLAIVEDLAREFSELDQFEEERECRAEARRLYFDFWAQQSPWRLPFLPLLRYLSLSLRSLPVFLCLVTLWIVLFGMGYHALDPYIFEKSRSFGEAFSVSTIYFFTLSIPDYGWYNASKQVLWNSILAFQSAVSLSHLGILVSHIYLIISRRQ